jgi:hypothetical protein
MKRHEIEKIKRKKIDEFEISEVFFRADEEAVSNSNKIKNKDTMKIMVKVGWSLSMWVV